MTSMTLTCYICNKPMQKGRSSNLQGEAAHQACRNEAYGKCTICGDKAIAKQLCPSHYSSARRTDPDKLASDRARRREREAKPEAPTVLCAWCTLPLMNYMPGRMSSTPLHKKCRATAPQWMVRGTPGPRQRAALAAIEKAARGTSGGSVWTSGNCAWCSKPYTRVSAKWCSRSCLTRAKMARRGKFSVRPADRLAIMERDEWTCGICETPIDPDAHYLDDWAGTLDHIVPVSRMLIPDHSEGNLRACHRWCNSVRGNDDWFDVAEVKRLAIDRRAA